MLRWGWRHNYARLCHRPILKCSTMQYTLRRCSPHHILIFTPDNLLFRIYEVGGVASYSFSVYRIAKHTHARTWYDKISCGGVALHIWDQETRRSRILSSIRMWYTRKRTVTQERSSSEFPSINYLRKLVISSNLMFCKLCVGVLVPLDSRHGA